MHLVRVVAELTEQGPGNTEERLTPGVLPRGGDSSWILKDEYEVAQQEKARRAERRVSAEAGDAGGQQHVVASGTACGPRGWITGWRNGEMPGRKGQLEGGWGKNLKARPRKP